MFHLPPLPRTLHACQQDFEHSDEKVRFDVARDLGRPAPDHERKGRIDLLRRYLRDSSPRLRRQALLSLADLGAKEACADVEPLLSDPEIPVRQLAVMALGELADPSDDRLVGRIGSLLTAGAPAIRYQALSATVHLRPLHSQEPLLRALQDVDQEVRVLALRLVEEALVARDEALVDALVLQIDRAARDAESSVRLMGQLLAHELGREAAVDAIVDCVRGRIRPAEARDEQMAIEWVGRLGLQEAVPILRRRAFGWFGWSVDPFKYTALGALARLGDGSAWSKLLKLLHSRSSSERAWAIDALSKSGRREALDALAASLSLGSPEEDALILAAKHRLRRELSGADSR